MEAIFWGWVEEVLQSSLEDEGGNLEGTKVPEAVTAIGVPLGSPLDKPPSDECSKLLSVSTGILGAWFDRAIELEVGGPHKG